MKTLLCMDLIYGASTKGYIHRSNAPIWHLKATILGTRFGRLQFEIFDQDTGYGPTFGSAMMGYSNFE